MTTKQQIEKFRQYWGISEVEMSKLQQLIIDDFLEIKKAKLEKQLEEYCSQITFTNYHGEVLW